MPGSGTRTFLEPDHYEASLRQAQIEILIALSSKFKARLTPPQGDALDYNGQCVWVSPGVLYIHYTASGGDEKNIVRVGNQVWVYHPLVGWVTSDEAGMPGAGRGVPSWRGNARP